MSEIEVKLNGTSAEKVKEALVFAFGNSISFGKISPNNTLIVKSLRKDVIDGMIIIAGLTITGEEM